MAASKSNKMFLLSLLLVQLSIIFAFDCNSKDLKLQIHIVPHTHDDVGWLKTVDEYYYGANRTIQAGAVQYILDTAIVSLQQNPNRTFIYVEMAFFKRWWDEQEDSVKSAVKKLLANKQLEFINGGWCMNDEGRQYGTGRISIRAEHPDWGINLYPIGVPMTQWGMQIFLFSLESLLCFCKF